MSGIRTVLDSNTIIYASKGLVDVEKLLLANVNYYASIITFIEVYAYDFTHAAEKIIVDEILDALEIVELTSEIADQTIIYRKNKIKKIKLPDAVILATAKFIGASLITNDSNDFDKIDPSVKVVDLSDFKI